MFNFIKNKLQKIYQSVTNKLASFFVNRTIDANTLHELEVLLIGADTGVKTTRLIIDALKKEYAQGTIKEGTDLKKALAIHLQAVLQQPDLSVYDAPIYLLVGINGSGKTTFAAKLANHFKNNHKKVLLVAGDTFRAAATEQLSQWAQKIHADIVIGKENQDPASVIFTGCQQYKEQGDDTLIIDTAGRLQTKTNLMNELAKIKRIINKQFSDKKIVTLLTVDSMLGQNSLEQAKLFKESTDLNGIILTKMDGTGKGGIVFAINHELCVPVVYISFGEQLDQFKPFNGQDYIHDLLNS